MNTTQAPNSLNALTPDVQEALSQLRDIQLPPPVSLWPLAPGYYLLILVLVLLALGIFLIHRHRKQNLWRRNALTQLKEIQDRFRVNNQKRVLAAQLNTLLKSVVLARQASLSNPSVNANLNVNVNVKGCAGLSGTAWVDFLCSMPLKDKRPVNQAALYCLRDAPYQPAPDFDAASLLEEAKRWIQKCS